MLDREMWRLNLKLLPQATLAEKREMKKYDFCVKL